MQPIRTVNYGAGGSYRPNFTAHLPRHFSAMMNYLYKKTPEDMFSCKDVMRVSTVLDNGREVSGVVNFLHGKYHSLVLDEGFQNLRQEFMRTALKRYNMSITKRQMHEKLGYVQK